MSEFVIHSDRVRDLTSARRPIAIEIEDSVTFEIALTIWSVFSEKATNAAYDLGPDWLENVRNQTSDDLAERIVTLGGPWCSTWLAVSSLMLSAPHPHDPDRVIDWLSTVDDNRLRRWILGSSSHSENQALIEQAAEGDLDAAVQLLGDQVEEKPGLVDHIEWLINTEGLPARYAEALREFRAEVFSEFEAEFAAAIGRAAAAEKATPTNGSAKEMVEKVTSGIDFEIPLGVTRVVLIPSMVTRPLSVIDVNRGTLLVFYGIADEYVDSDPDAPPSWLVRTYKALGDERRLRIMRRLSEGPASLDDLTELLDLSKSTVHHHIALLRGAGLIRIHIPEDKSSSKKSFSLREQSLVDAAGFLDSYLTTAEEKTNAL
jgi:DNA-binding transcriptional ArsR family regulator